MVATVKKSVNEEKSIKNIMGILDTFIFPSFEKIRTFITIFTLKVTNFFFQFLHQFSLGVLPFFGAKIQTREKKLIFAPKINIFRLNHFGTFWPRKIQV